MKKRKKSKKGFTLVEVLVSLVVIGIIVGSGIANYWRLNEVKTVENAARQAEQSIRDTQKLSASGTKPEECISAGGKLQSYTIELGDFSGPFGLLSEDQYRIYANCTGDLQVEKGIYSLPEGTKFQSPNMVDYNLLGRADADKTIFITNDDESLVYQIDISQGGALSFARKVEVTPTPTGALVPTATPTPYAGGVITHEETVTGGSIASGQVTTSSRITGVDGNLYLAAISPKPYRNVNYVSGLGLTWGRVKAQCGFDSQTSVEVWRAQGTPSGDGFVTANVDSSNLKATAMAVSRYSGVNLTSPIGSVVSANYNGIDGACAGGMRSKTYSFPISTTSSGSMVYAAIALRNRTHTPGSGYTELAEYTAVAPSSGDNAGIAVMQQEIALPATVLVEGSVSGSDGTNWAVVALEIKM